MNAPRTARERARVEITAEIKNAARRQLAAQGADALSLRAVARELGMASSAVYRYFATKDDLLTALIIDAYDGLGAAVEKADRAWPRAQVRTRWLAAAAAVRRWALAHQHEYALIYGSPVPGYRAPQATVPPAARVPRVLLGVLADGVPRDQPIDAAGPDPAPVGQDGNRLTAPDPAPVGQDDAQPTASSLGGPTSAIPPGLAGQLREIAAAMAPVVDPGALLRALIAWTQLFGMISFELFGQLVGSVDPADEFFTRSAAMMADYVGLVDRSA